MKPFFNFRNEANEAAAELAIYDVVGFYGTTAKDFYASLKAIGDRALNVRINSPGGSVVDGFAIYNLLKAHKGDVTVFIDGLAASIASVIAMAGDKVIMPKNALMMIHNPSVFADGDAESLRKLADDLDKFRDGIVSAYTERTGKKADKIKKMMDEETFITAEEAVEMGFADEIGKAVKITNCFKDYVPTDVHAKLSTAVDSVPGGSTETDSKDTMTPEQIAALQNQVTTLTAEKKQIVDGHKTEIETAKNTARQEAETAENTRRTKIQEIASKYNKNGDLNEATIKALAGKVTPDEFKDQVLELVNARPTKGAIKPGSNGKDDSKDETVTDEITTVEEFKAAYAKCADTSSRLALGRKYRNLARLAIKQGESTE